MCVIINFLAVTQKPIPAATTTTQVVSVPAFNQSAKSSEMKKESKPEKSVIKEGKAVRLAQNLTVRQGKQRIMPIPHVEYLLEVYAEYLDKRMLESGRLSKGKSKKKWKKVYRKIIKEHSTKLPPIWMQSSKSLTTSAIRYILFVVVLWTFFNINQRLHRSCKTWRFSIKTVK